MQYLFTERAHLMCPNMNFAIAMCINAPLDPEKVMAASDMLAKAHPFLNAVLGYDKENDKYFYKVTMDPKIEVIPSPENISQIDAPQVMAEHAFLCGYDWELFKEGMLKIACWRMDDKMCVLLVCHHLLTDGRGLLGLAREFADLYVEGKAPSHAPETLITAADLPEDSRMPWISRTLVNNANKNWRKEGKRLSYDDYHRYAMEFVKNDKITHKVKRIVRPDLSSTLDECRDHSVSLNDLLIARMMLEEHTDNIIIAIDLREKLSCYSKGALGNYATAFSVKVKKKTSDVWELASAVHNEVARKFGNPSDLYLVLQCYANLEPGLLDAAFMSARGAYASKSANFIGTRFFNFAESQGFSITNLGRIENPNITSAFFIPPASPAIRKIKGVLSVNGEMMICSSERE